MAIRYYSCRDCRNAYNRRAQKKPWGRAWSLNYQHTKRALAAGGFADATTQDVFNAMKAAKGSCHYCQRKAKLTLDHIIPISRAGPHTASNLIMACASCNSSKGDKEASVFARKIGILII